MTKSLPIDVRVLDGLGLSSVVQTFDSLVWQAFASTDGKNWWSNPIDGCEYDVSSEELYEINKFEPLVILYEGEVW